MCSRIDNFQQKEMKPWQETTSDIGLYVYKIWKSRFIPSYQTRVHKLPHVEGGRTDRQTDTLNPISLRFTGDKNTLAKQYR